MRSSRFLSIVTGFALLAAAPAWGALSAQSAQSIGAELTSAYLTATVVEREIADVVGKKFPASLSAGLEAIDRAAAKAESLANGDPHLADGLTRVRALLRDIRGGDTVRSEAVSMMTEVTIKLYAMEVNANVLQASAHLRNALDNIGKGRWKEQELYLRNAVRALQEAATHGGYHMENDIEEIQGQLARMQDSVNHEIPLLREDVEARIEEIEDHLFDVRAVR